MNANAQHHDIDNTIDRALSALRDAQPRSGLESRILANLEHRSATEPGGLPFHNVKGWGIVCGSKRGNAHRAAHLALWTATAAIIAAASLLILHHHTTQSEMARTPATRVAHPFANAKGWGRDADADTNFAGSAHHQPTQTLSSRVELIGHHPERSAIARSRRTSVFESCSDHHATGCPVHDNGAAAVMSGGTTPTDAQLLADLHAPSHPAPPFTLTPQEKLFLRTLRYGNLTQLAELNPEVRAKHDAEETTAFKAFFPDPPPLEQPLGDAE